MSIALQASCAICIKFQGCCYYSYKKQEDVQIENQKPFIEPSQDFKQMAKGPTTLEMN